MRKEKWYCANHLQEDQFKVLVPLVVNCGYDGVLLSIHQKKYFDIIPKSMKKLLYVTEEDVQDVKKYLDKSNVNDCNETSQSRRENKVLQANASKHSLSLSPSTSEDSEKPNSLNECGLSENIMIVSRSERILESFQCSKVLYLSVNDKQTLDRTIIASNQYKYILIDFKSETNIPLELVLAFSQKNNCNICKKVSSVDAGVVASTVMEMGSHSILLDSTDPDTIIKLAKEFEKIASNKLEIKKLTVIESKHIGMRDRVCIDTTSILRDDEGIILGSTSTGGILVSSETHFLPYMELRPFRVNAGGIHMYAWNENDKTDYLSELKGGSFVMAVDSKGNTRTVAVGRVKIERRPLLMICAQDEEKNVVSVVVQDDWHVRIIGIGGKALNCTELKKGDEILGYTCENGRHVGVKIDETIIEK